ncbi:hypothetical protein ZIOFF_034569 [Zingiber officinale]|uniref:Pentatricopeptide repeat-containing protein n=1 Tax=Zingiber officinale TaxID=94328 RepID=A0A8J5GS98_ZINOF|nr:hypothetical protein ZIOFF_034569 [Zingiber officinale]
MDAIRHRSTRRPSFRGHSTISDPVSAVPVAVGGKETDHSSDFISRLSQILKFFPAQSRSSFPEPGARPLESDPFHYNLLMKAFSCAGNLHEVLRLFRDMKEAKCDPDIFCYTTVLDALLAANRSEDAEKVFDEMIKSGVKLDAGPLTVLVKYYSFYLKRFDSARQIIEWMVQSGCDPDVVTYSTLIAGLCRAGMVEEAWNVMDQMLLGNCAPNAHSYTPFLQAYCSQGKVEAAMRLMEAMRSLGCPPDAVAYNILINGLCKHGYFDQVAHILESDVSYGWEPDAVTYNTYISGLCKAGMADAAFKQLEIMLEKKLCPTVVTLNIVLDNICRESSVWEGNHLLERSLELGIYIDVVSYNTIMSRLCEIGKFSWVLKLFTDMLKKEQDLLERSLELGIYIDVVSYNTIMSRLCEIGKFSWVLKLFTDMLKKGIRPDTETFNIVIHCLCKAGKYMTAKYIFVSNGFVADIVTCNILIHEFYRAGKIDELQNLFAVMNMVNIKPDKITNSTIVDGLCRNRKFVEAINFVRSVEGVSSNRGIQDRVDIVEAEDRFMSCRAGDVQVTLLLNRQAFHPEKPIDVQLASPIN